MGAAPERNVNAWVAAYPAGGGHCARAWARWTLQPFRMHSVRCLALALSGYCLLACAGPPFAAANSCSSAGMTLEASRSVLCSGVDSMVQRSQATVVPPGLFTQQQFNGAVSGLTVWLWPDADTIPESACDDATGCLLLGEATVYLADHGASFTHELMHRLDEERGVPDDANKAHLGWGQRGALPDAGTHPCQPWASPPCLDGSWEDVAFSAHVTQAFEGVTDG